VLLALEQFKIDLPHVFRLRHRPAASENLRHIKKVACFGVLAVLVLADEDDDNLYAKCSIKQSPQEASCGLFVTNANATRVLCV